MKRITILCIILVLLVVGCGKEEVTFKYDNKKKVDLLKEIELSEVSERLYQPWQVQGFFSLYWTRELLLNSGIGTTLRYNQGRYYSIDPLSDKRYLMILYDEMSHRPLDDKKTLYMVDSYIVSTLVDRATFEEAVQIGTKMEEVRLADENGVFGDCLSYHRFRDKSMLAIHYTINEDTLSKEVDQIMECEVDKSVLTYMLPDDFAVLVD